MAHDNSRTKMTPKPAFLASSVWFVVLLTPSLMLNTETPTTYKPNILAPEPNRLVAKHIALNSDDYIPIQGGDALEIQASFIVRFSDEPEVADVARNFRKDPANSQIRFARWAREHPALQGLVLTSASYSGELILSLPANDPLNRRPRDVLRAIRAMESCAYAELDSVAYPSSGGK